MADELSRSEDRHYALFDAVAESVAEQSDEEAVEEARAAGEDPTSCADEVRALLLQALATRGPESEGAPEPDTPEVDTTTYVLEVRLTRTRTSDRKRWRRSFGWLFGERRPGPKDEEPPEDSNSRSSLAGRLRPATPWLAAASAVVVVVLGAETLPLLRERPASPPPGASELPPAPPAQTAIAPGAGAPTVSPPEPGGAASPPIQSARVSPPERSPGRGSPRHPELRGAPRPTLRLGDIRTVSVDPQTDPFAARFRAALVAELNAGGPLSVTEDAAGANARIRIDRRGTGHLAVALISGRSVVWTTTERVDERDPEGATRSARRVAARLLEAARGPGR
jgi:hypothetical protein